MNWYSIYKFAQETKQDVVQKWLESMRDMKKTFAIPKNFVYSGLEDLLLQHGTKYKSQPLTQEEMDVIKLTVKNAWKYVCKQCYFNSQTIASSSKGKIKYVEGVAFCDLIPMNHAWNTINGKVLDFTWKHRNNNLPVLGIIPEGWEYYGVEFEVTKQEMKEHIKKHNEVKAYLDDWRNHFEVFSKPYQKPV